MHIFLLCHFSQASEISISMNIGQTQDLIKLLNSYWLQGDHKQEWKNGLLKCENFPLYKENIGPDFLKCNPEFIQCLIKKKKLSGINPEYKMIFKKDNHLLGTHDYFAYIFEITVNNKEAELILFDRCHEVSLFQGIYATGKMEVDSADWKWDNRGQQILIDQYMVTNLEVDRWIKARKIKLASPFVLTPQSFYRQSISLNLDEMKQYCLDHGKQMLSTRVFEAATFYRNPTEYPIEKLQTFKKIFRSKYPWSAKNSSTFIPQSKGEWINFQHSFEYCPFIYSAECLGKSPFLYYMTPHPSWTGLAEVLGGIPEILWDDRLHRARVKHSSFFFNLNSPWHEIGVYGDWDGSGHGAFHYGFVSLDKEYRIDQGDEKHYASGFRCMRYKAP